MRITRQAFTDAQKAPANRAVIEKIDVAIAKGEQVIVEEPDGSESLVQPSTRTWYKTTPLTPASAA